MYRLALALLVFGACDNVCDEAQVEDEATVASNITGSLDVGMPNGPAHLGLDPSSQLSGFLHDGVSDDIDLAIVADAGTYKISLDSSAPDLRRLDRGQVIAVPVSGGIDFGDSFCNVAGQANLTITDAGGAAAPFPDVVTDNFVRSATFELTSATFTPVDGTDHPCPSSIAVSATVAVTKLAYQPVYHTENCPDLSR